MKHLASRLAFIVIVMVCAHASAQSKNIHENVDPYTNLRSLFLEVSTRTCPGDPSLRDHDPDVHLLFTAFETRDGKVLYYLTPELDRGNSLGLRTNGTMDTLIDGVAGSLTTQSGSTVVTRYDYKQSFLHETIPFVVSQADLSKISNTDFFQFRVNGPKQAVQRCVDAKHLRDLPEFLSAASEYGVAQAPVDPNAQHLVLRTEPSNNLKSVKLENIATQPCPGDAAPSAHHADVHVAVSANQRSDGGVWYYFTVDVSNAAAVNLRRGDNMQISMDGVDGTFHTINGSLLSAIPDASGQPVMHETIAFHVHQPDIVALSKTSLMEFRLKGSDQTIQRCIAAKDLKALPQFITSAITLTQPVASAQHP